MQRNLQEWSGSLKLSQGGFLVTMLIYVLVFCGGGFFSAYYAWMLAIAAGLCAALISMIQKNLLVMLVDLGLVALMFISFIQLA